MEVEGGAEEVEVDEAVMFDIVVVVVVVVIVEVVVEAAAAEVVSDEPLKRLLKNSITVSESLFRCMTF